jgi:hypothetical protein
MRDLLEREMLATPAVSWVVDAGEMLLLEELPLELEPVVLVLLEPVALELAELAPLRPLPLCRPLL